MPVKREDAQRYNEICLQYYDAILSFCNARMGFRLEDAKDCTQQVFQLLLEKLPYLDTEKNILAWLYRVARNMIARYYDQCKKEADKILYLDGLTDREETMAHLVTVDAYPVDKEEEWDEDKLNTVKEEVLQHLDMDSRKLLELRYDRKLSYRQITGLTNVSENTLRQRTFVLKNRIKKIVNQILK